MTGGSATMAFLPASPSRIPRKDHREADSEIDDVASSSSWVTLDETNRGRDPDRNKRDTPATNQEESNHHDTRDKPALPAPTYRLHLNNLRHPGSTFFLSWFPNLESVLETALAVIVEHLYTSEPGGFHPSIPPTRSVTVIVHDFPGVAYTTGIDLDDDHKEIHLSLSYIRTWAEKPNPERELAGVLTHELVHCYQHTTPPDADEDTPHPPSGLIEGIADFVRLKADLVPPHWKRPSSAKDRGPRWDAGYQVTAFFLAWLDDIRVGRGAVAMVNDRLLRVGYIGEDAPQTQPDGFWKGLFGVDVLELWEEYGRYLDGS